MQKMIGQMVVTALVVFGLGACSKEQPKQYDAKALLETKCASCHNLDMPAKSADDEKAPPMMAISFHVADFIKVAAPSEKKPKFIAFFQDFVLAPSIEKSFCDKKSLDSYGLMPSLKGKVSKEEVGAIATYVFEHFNQERFLKQMQAKLAFESLSKGEQIATKKGCFTCHAMKDVKAAPSFVQIAQKSEKEILEGITKGSKGKWKGFERMMMPSYEKNLNAEELKTLIEWIKGLKIG